MSIPRAFTLGLLAAFAAVFLLYLGERLPGETLVTLVALPVTCVTGLAIFERGSREWAWRLARGMVGAVLAGVASCVTLYCLPEWFDYRDPSIGLVLIGLAAACGWIAAAAARPSRGLAMAIGFDLGLVDLTIPSLIIEPGRDLGFVVGAALVLATGAVVGALLGRVAR